MRNEEASVDDLLGMSRRRLDEIYASCEAGPIPHGDSRGRGLALPGTGFNRPLSRVAGLLWQGKVFDPATSTLINKVLGLRLFVARVYRAESWFDGKPSIIIDRDEA